MHETTTPGLGELLGEAMDRLYRLRGVLDPATAAHGLDVSVSEALSIGRLAHGRTTQSELRRHLGLERSTVSRLVDGLVARGWVERGVDPANQRERTLALTPPGVEAADRLAAAMRERHRAMVDALTDAERAALAVALPALLRVAGAPHR